MNLANTTRHPFIISLPEKLGLPHLGTCMIRQSRRYRYLRLSFNWQKGLMLTTPVPLSIQQVHEYLNHHHDWLLNIQKKIQSQASSKPVTQLLDIADISFNTLSKQWELHFISDSTKRSVKITETSLNRLEISGNLDHPLYLKKALRQWLVHQANHYLAPYFWNFAQRHGFKVEKLKWRVMSSRWGSCSSTGKICLNALLLFLPWEQIEYVFAHELCHLYVMSHNPAFYGHLKTLLPDYRQKEKALKTCNGNLPSWVVHLYQ